MSTRIRSMVCSAAMLAGGILLRQLLARGRTERLRDRYDPRADRDGARPGRRSCGRAAGHRLVAEPHWAGGLSAPNVRAATTAASRLRSAAARRCLDQPLPSRARSAVLRTPMPPAPRRRMPPVSLAPSRPGSAATTATIRSWTSGPALDRSRPPTAPWSPVTSPTSSTAPRGLAAPIACARPSTATFTAIGFRY